MESAAPSSSSAAAASSSPTVWSAGRAPVSSSLTPKWYLPRSVALRVVAAHQKVRYTTAGEPATDLTGVLPDHRCVMTDAWPGSLPGVICHLFFDPLIGKFHRCTSPLFFGKIRRPSDPCSYVLVISTMGRNRLASLGRGAHTVPSVVK